MTLPSPNRFKDIYDRVWSECVSTVVRKGLPPEARRQLMEFAIATDDKIKDVVRKGRELRISEIPEYPFIVPNNPFEGLIKNYDISPEKLTPVLGALGGWRKGNATFIVYDKRRYDRELIDFKPGRKVIVIILPGGSSLVYLKDAWQITLKVAKNYPDIEFVGIMPQVEPSGRDLTEMVHKFLGWNTPHAMVTCLGQRDAEVEHTISELSRAGVRQLFFNVPIQQFPGPDTKFDVAIGTPEGTIKSLVDSLPVKADKLRIAYGDEDFQSRLRLQDVIDLCIDRFGVKPSSYRTDLRQSTVMGNKDFEKEGLWIALHSMLVTGLRALRDRERLPSIRIYGIDGHSMNIESLRAGALDLLQCRFVDYQLWFALILAASPELRNRSKNVRLPIQPAIFDRENIHEYKRTFAVTNSKSLELFHELLG